MTFVFDLDGTILTEEKGNYAAAQPIPGRIEKLQDLEREGHSIVIQTARGYLWEDYTEQQLNLYGIPYHVLSVGAKAYGDYYIDNKAINAKDFFK